MSFARERLDRAIVTAAFFLTGVASVLLGPILPELSAQWGVGPSQLATLFVAQFATSSLGSVASSLNLRASLIGGYGLIALGLVSLALGGWWAARPAIALVGLGLGLSIAGSNLWTAERSPERRGAVLATLNLSWGLGAVSSPLLVAAAVERLSLETFLGLLAVTAVLCSLALVAVLPPRVRAAVRRGPTSGAKAPPMAVLVVMAAMFFVYVGSENAVAGWLVTLADEIAGGRTTVSLIIGSGFWGAVLAGRAVAPWVLARVSEPRLYSACLAIALLGVLLLAVAESRPWVIAGTIVAGLGMAPLFPLTVSALVAVTVSGGSRRNGLVLAFGGLGGAAIPWLTGRVAESAGELRVGFLVPLVGFGLLSLLFTMRRRLHA